MNKPLILVFIVFAQLFCSAAVPPVNAKVIGDFERLIDVSHAIDSNGESIQTWTGEAEITDHRLQAGKLALESKAQVRFAYDGVNENVRINYDAYGSSIKSDQLIYSSSNMWRDDESIQFGPNYKNQSGKRWNAYLSAKRQSAEILANDYDPMFFTRVNREEGLSTFLSSFNKELASNKEVREIVSCELKDDDQGRFIVDFREPGFFNTYIFDPKFDYSLVNFSAGGGEVKETWEIEYVKQADVSVPRSWSYVNEVVSGSTAKIRFRRKVVIKSQEVNEPLPANAFSLASMGIRSGDVVNDSIRGGQYVVGKDWKLNDLESGLRTEIDAPNKERSSLFLYANAAVVVLLAAWVISRRLARQKYEAT